MSTDDRKRERKFHLCGWILFLVCAGFFIASSVEDNNTLSLVGSIIFLFACVVFLIPLVVK
jgi:predicted membrane channel-forming protein YqfA (hemolysin III family)